MIHLRSRWHQRPIQMIDIQLTHKKQHICQKSYNQLYPSHFFRAWLPACLASNPERPSFFAASHPEQYALEEGTHTQKYNVIQQEGTYTEAQRDSQTFFYVG